MRSAVSLSPRPMAMEARGAPPMPTRLAKAEINMITGKATPTPASANAPVSGILPTNTRSTRLYSRLTTWARMEGSARRSNRCPRASVPSPLSAGIPALSPFFPTIPILPCDAIHQGAGILPRKRTRYRATQSRQLPRFRHEVPRPGWKPLYSKTPPKRKPPTGYSGREQASDGVSRNTFTPERQHPAQRRRFPPWLWQSCTSVWRYGVHDPLHKNNIFP